MFNCCIDCGRPIYDKKSRERGYGPVCWSKLSLADKISIDVNSIKDEKLRKIIREKMNG